MADAIRQVRMKFLKDAFDEFDKNQDGSISVQELGDALKSVGIDRSEERLQAMIEEVDQDNSGTINFEEFVRMTEKYPEEFETYKEEELRAVFHHFDKDNNGYISARDLQEVLTNMGETISEEEAAEMLRLADFDGDGKISYSEFVTMMTTN